MSQLGKIITFGLLFMFGITLFGFSRSGVGASTFKDHKTMAELKKNCPNYYQNVNGECLRTTFRSIYFIRGFSGGGSSGGSSGGGGK